MVSDKPVFKCHITLGKFIDFSFIFCKRDKIMVKVAIVINT